MITRKRKNPILRKAGGINYEIIDPPIFDEEKLIRKFSEILNRKFRVLVNKVPTIVFKDLEGYSAGLTTFKGNVVESIILCSKRSNHNDEQLRILFHEVGHFVYNNILAEKAIILFEDYVSDNTKKIKIRRFINLLNNKYTQEDIRTEDPVAYVIIDHLRNHDLYKYYNKHISKIKSPLNIDFLLWVDSFNNLRVFDKPASAYMPDEEEIFCEIFANYMMYDLRLLHSDNYRILKTLIPELRS